MNENKTASLKFVSIKANESLVTCANVILKETQTLSGSHIV